MQLRRVTWLRGAPGEAEVCFASDGPRVLVAAGTTLMAAAEWAGVPIGAVVIGGWPDGPGVIDSVAAVW